MRKIGQPITGLLFGVALAMATFIQGALAGPPVPVVVELYTSQGCNSCPPADRLLGKLASRDDVIALTFNVDYWDYLGWKDTLAQPSHTERQRQYAAALRNRTVYTPQMVIGGRQHAVGSDASAVAAAIEAEQRNGKDNTNGNAGPVLRLQHQDGHILFSLSAVSDPSTDATIWLVRYDQRRDVPIERGENAGNNLVYHNVVREMRPLGQWHGQALKMSLSREMLSEGGRDGCAIIVQKGSVGPILAAARITF